MLAEELHHATAARSANVVNNNQKKRKQNRAAFSLSSPRFQTGSWIGDFWIPPPGWHLHTVHEIQETFQGRSVLWIGDSTARRASATLYAILNQTMAATTSTNQTSTIADSLSVHALDANHVININKRTITESCTRHNWGDLRPRKKGQDRPNYCRPMPDDRNHDYLMIGKLCFFQLEDFLRKEISGISNFTSYVDLLIVSIGIWHNANAGYCQRGNESNPHVNQLHGALEALYQLQTTARSNLTILWRTTGFTDRLSPDIPHEIDNHVMDYMDQRQQEENTRVHYVHWSGAMEPRSFGEERLKGDNPSHYNLQARLVLIQMIVNTLNEGQARGTRLEATKADS